MCRYPQVLHQSPPHRLSQLSSEMSYLEGVGGGPPPVFLVSILCLATFFSAFSLTLLLVGFLETLTGEGGRFGPLEISRTVRPISIG